MARCGPMANFRLPRKSLRCQYPRRLPRRNPHPIKSMPTLIVRRSKLSARLRACACIVCFATAGGIRADALPNEGQNPNRPPWAQKSKSSDAGANPSTAKTASSDPEQDRSKIKVSVNLVNVLVSVLDGPPLLLRNKGRQEGHWLSVKALGVRSNRDGFGARIQVKAAGLTQSGEVRANASFESASDPRLHFGLGAATSVDSIEVRWPSGVVDKIGPLPANQEITLEEGEGVVPATTPLRTEKPAKSRPTRTKD